MSPRDNQSGCVATAEATPHRRHARDTRRLPVSNACGRRTTDGKQGEPSPGPVPRIASRRMAWAVPTAISPADGDPVRAQTVVTPLAELLRICCIATVAVAIAALLRIWPLDMLDGRMMRLTVHPAALVVTLLRGFSDGMPATKASCLAGIRAGPHLIGTPFINAPVDRLAAGISCLNGVTPCEPGPEPGRLLERHVERPEYSLILHALNGTKTQS